MIAWMISNFQAVLSVLAALLGVVVMALHLAHKDEVAAKIQGIEDMINKVDGQAPKA